MTSQLNVDTILDKAGSGGSNIKIANTSVTVSEGGAATTTTVQGLAKHWVMFQGTDTFAARDSLNLSSLVDDGTAVHTTNYTSNFANDDYASSLSLGHTNISDGWGSIEETNTARTTSSLQVTQYNGDFAVNSIILHGDLA